MKTENGFQKSKHAYHLVVSALCVCVSQSLCWSELFGLYTLAIAGELPASLLYEIYVRQKKDNTLNSNYVFIIPRNMYISLTF